MSAVVLALSLGLAACGGGGDEPAAQPQDTAGAGAGPVVPGGAQTTATSTAAAAPSRPFERIDPASVEDFEVPDEEGVGPWRDAVEGIRDVRIPRSGGGEGRQPALHRRARGDGDQPLLVVVHSWSQGYTQPQGIPLAEWAADNGWGVIAPDFGGVNDDPRATGSDRAVRDVGDAIDYAVERGGVDEERIYTAGYSGGGMMSLLAAARLGDRVDAAVSWVPVTDLPRWYAYKAEQEPIEDYVGQIEASCGGPPQPGTQAEASCARRSPLRWMADLREAGTPVYLGVGIEDDNVPPDQGLRAFNLLADPAGRLTPAQVRASSRGRLGALRGDVDAESRFADDDPDVLHARSSAGATLVVFDGGHDLVYNPGLEWLASAPRRSAG